MSIRKQTTIRCDGCHEEIDNAPADTKTRREDRLDLCDDCDSHDKYICKTCWRVHDDDDLTCPHLIKYRQEFQA